MNPEFQNVDLFINRFRTGMEEGSSLELLFIFSLFGIIAYLYYRQYRRKAEAGQAEKEARNTKFFKRYCERFAITPSEKVVLKQMMAFLPEPASQSHLLFEQEDLFNRCAGQLREKTDRFNYAILALKVKLPFLSKKEGKIIRSTAEIPHETKIFSEEANIPLLKVVEVQPSCLVAEKIAPLKPGVRELSLYFIRKEGLYHFTAKVIRQEGEVVFLRHCDLLFRKQSRAFFRHHLRLAVDLDNREGETLDLGGGGANIRLLEGDFADLIEGEAYDLVIKFSETRYVNCVARLVAIAGDGSIRCEFTNILEPDRDHILSHLLRAGALQE